VRFLNIATFCSTTGTKPYSNAVVHHHVVALENIRTMYVWKSSTYTRTTHQVAFRVADEDDELPWVRGSGILTELSSTQVRIVEGGSRTDSSNGSNSKVCCQIDTDIASEKVIATGSTILLDWFVGRLPSCACLRNEATTACGVLHVLRRRK